MSPVDKTLVLAVGLLDPSIALSLKLCSVISFTVKDDSEGDTRIRRNETGRTRMEYGANIIDTFVRVVCSSAVPSFVLDV